MDFTQICLVFVVIFYKRSASSPIEQRCQNQLTTQDRLVQMGKGLSQIPQGHINIKVLNVAYNHLKILPEQTFQDNCYKNLNKIDMKQNSISNISERAFKGLKQMKKIDLSDNDLTTLEPYTFKFSPRLEELDLSQNKIKFVKNQVFITCTALETLILSNNRIEQLYEVTFIGVPNLSNLILDNNVIFKVEVKTFSPLRSIHYLSIANTGVDELTGEMFDKHPKIINLEGTPLANKFHPPLRRMKNNNVTSLLKLSERLSKGL